MMDQDDIESVISPAETDRIEDENSRINISDVIDVIRTTDPTAVAMFSSVSDVTGMQSPQNHPQPHHSNHTSEMPNPSTSINNYRRNAFVKITEQPASKALRFRYECEGRSAGSIPGVLSSPENKTFPSISVVGYRGRAVVVVSCVTKDPPYRPHPHNLVGKEGCKKGVCTVEINSDTMSVTFSNLGIQCVKKRDIEEALRVREEIRVDPYRTGFNHRSQPSSIDLNAVRLCFQVFLESEQRGRFTVPLSPVVSDPIFDKKAMSDLVICKLSDASCTVAGGKEMILLCEKVAKEDISVRFFEERDGNIVWEGYGDFQHTNVHKQVAISFRTPRYKSIDVFEQIRCYIQLKRPSDGVTSEALPFDYLPMNSGRRSIWTARKGLKEKGSFELLNRILAEDKSYNCANGQNKLEIIDLDTPVEDEKSPVISEQINEPLGIDECVNDQRSQTLLQSNDKTTEWIQKTEFQQEDEHLLKTENTIDDDKTLNELLDQVAELDEIYTDHQLKMDNGQIERELNGLENSLPKTNDETTMDLDDLFDDSATYTSLQIAFKNPVPIIDLLPPSPPVTYSFDNSHYDAVEAQIINATGPIIDVGTLKRESPKLDDEKLPPLPPKRVKKSSSNVDNNENQPMQEHFQPEELVSSNTSSPKSPQQRYPPSKIIIMKTPDQSPLNKRLPPAPPSQSNSNSLPKQQKKPGFFSKLFSRRKSKSDVNENVNSNCKSSVDISPDSSLNNFHVNDPNRASIKSLQMPTKKAHSKPVGRSVSSVSGKRPNLTADIVHIPLKGDSLNSIPMKTGSGTLLALPGTEAYERASTATLSNNLDRKTVSALQLADLPLQEGNMELIAIADRQSLKNLCEGEFGVQLDPSVDLTEAEHYALYTSVAPHATESEFDETSCYYAPVEAGEILTQSEVARRLANPAEAKRKRLKVGSEINLFNHLRAQDQHHQDGQIGLGLPNITDPKIKKEPMDNSLSPFYRYDQSPQPLSPAKPSIPNQTPYNITPNITQFGAHQITNSIPSQQFNPMQNPFNIPSIISPTKFTPTMHNNTESPSTYANAVQPCLSEPNMELNILLDMDNQQFTNINSAELSGLSLSLLDGDYPSTNVATEAARTTINNQMDQDQDNLTDSFTQFATDAIRELNNDLNNFNNNNNDNNDRNKF